MAQNQRDTLVIDSLVDILEDGSMAYEERIDSFVSARGRGGVHDFLPYSCEEVGEAMDRLVREAPNEEDRLKMMIQRGYMALHCDSLNQQIKLYEEMLDLAKKLDDRAAETTVYDWLAQVYERNSLRDKSLKYSLLAARTMANRKDIDSAAISSYLSRSGFGLMSAAVERNDSSLLDTALFYTKMAYDHCICLKCDRMEPTIVYAMNLDRAGQPKAAVEVLTEGYEYSAETNNDFYLMRFARQLSDVYGNLGAFGIAEEYMLSAIEIHQKNINTEDPEVIILDEYGPVHMVNVYFLYGVFTKAGEYDKAAGLLDQIFYEDFDYEASQFAQNVMGRAARIYFKAGEFEKSSELYQMALKQERERIRDISNRFAETNRAHTLVQMDLQRQRNEAERLQHQAKVEREREYQRNIRYALIGGAALLAIFLLFIYNRFRISNKQNMIIQAQKQTVEETLGELEVKNKEILDSISYAKRLQEAILPPIEHIEEAFDDAFVYYQPKDIIAGDFYFMDEVDGVLFIAAADCTGHGVPGAMVSVVCANALNKAITDDKITDPGKILDRTRELVMKQFERHGEKIKDGMDICLVALKGYGGEASGSQKFQLEYAGANNPLWVISNEGRKNGAITELKPDKQPIGQHIVRDSFRTHKLEVSKGDQLYLFSDGYYDQFGGSDQGGKKFKPRRMQRLLVDIAGRSMEDQKAELHRIFLKWKGELEQVDDVCVIGLRL